MNCVNKILTKVSPFVKWFGSLHLPFTRKKITGKDYYKWRDNITIGDVFLTTTNGELSNLINPSKIKHSGLYVGDILGNEIKYVAEATGKGVVLTDLVTFLTTKDMVIGCRLKDKKDDLYQFELQQHVKRYVGREYDYIFNSGKDSFYCFELCAQCIKDCDPKIQIKQFEIVAGKSVYSEDTFLDPSTFSTTIDSREKK